VTISLIIPHIADDCKLSGTIINIAADVNKKYEILISNSSCTGTEVCATRKNELISFMAKQVSKQGLPRPSSEGLAMVTRNGFRIILRLKDRRLE
jgi:hypothetical protein